MRAHCDCLSRDWPIVPRSGLLHFVAACKGVIKKSCPLSSSPSADFLRLWWHRVRGYTDATRSIIDPSTSNDLQLHPGPSRRQTGTSAAWQQRYRHIVHSDLELSGQDTRQSTPRIATTMSTSRTSNMAPPQRPFFLSSLLASFRTQTAQAALRQQAAKANKEQAASSQATSTAVAANASTQTPSPATTAASSRGGIAVATAAAAAVAAATVSRNAVGGTSAGSTGSVRNTVPLHSAARPIPNARQRSHHHHHHRHSHQQTGTSPGPSTTTSPPTTAAAMTSMGAGHRRGSDSSSEGFRDAPTAPGAGPWYIGGRTATGEERFYKLGVVRRSRSGDRLSLDRLSL